MPKVANTLVEALQKAYHGSPHKFDKFSMEHIGTGEGAQGYGHGLYFAENPKIADWYKKTLSKEGKEGAVYEVSIPAKDKLLDWDGPLSKQPNEVKEKLKALGFDDSPEFVAQYALDTSDEIITRATALEGGLSHRAPPYFKQSIDDLLQDVGSMRVALAGDDAQKALSLAHTIRGKADEAMNNFTSSYANDDTAFQSALWNMAATADDVYKLSMSGGLTGRQIYERLRRGATQDKASSALREAGIPGLKYLDGTSRNTGKGSHNFVIWDDSKINMDLVKALAGVGVIGGAATSQDAEAGALGKALQKLPMDKASRMQRAKEMGFDTDKVWYHGTQKDFSDFQGGGISADADFFTENPSLSAKFAEGLGVDEEGIAAGATSIPVYLKASKPFDHTNPEHVKRVVESIETDDLGKFKWYTSTNRDNYITHQFQEGFGPFNKKSLEDGIAKGDYGFIESPTITDAMKRAGFDSFKVKEGAGGMKGFADDVNIGVFDPKNIRSVNAAFDPAKKDSTNLLASLTGAGILGSAAIPEDAQASIVNAMLSQPTPPPTALELAILAQQGPLNVDTGQYIPSRAPMVNAAGDFIKGNEVLDILFGGIGDWAQNVGYPDTNKRRLQRAAGATLDLF